MAGQGPAWANPGPAYLLGLVVGAAVAFDYDQDLEEAQETHNPGTAQPLTVVLPDRFLVIREPMRRDTPTGVTGSKFGVLYFARTRMWSHVPPPTTRDKVPAGEFPTPTKSVYQADAPHMAGACMWVLGPCVATWSEW